MKMHSFVLFIAFFIYNYGVFLKISDKSHLARYDLITEGVRVVSAPFTVYFLCSLHLLKILNLKTISKIIWSGVLHNS